MGYGGGLGYAVRKTNGWRSTMWKCVFPSKPPIIPALAMPVIQVPEQHGPTQWRAKSRCLPRLTGSYPATCSRSDTHAHHRA
jgi:hypothetical protein